MTSEEKFTQLVNRIENHQYFAVPNPVPPTSAADCNKRFGQRDRQMVRLWNLTMALDQEGAPKLPVRKVTMPMAGNVPIFMKPSCNCGGQTKLKWGSKKVDRERIDNYLRNWLKAAKAWLKTGDVQPVHSSKDRKQNPLI